MSAHFKAIGWALAATALMSMLGACGGGSKKSPSDEAVTTPGTTTPGTTTPGTTTPTTPGTGDGQDTACEVPESWALPPTTIIVGTGTPQSCTSDALGAAVAKAVDLAQGGRVTFSCGSAPTTIAITHEITVQQSANAEVVLDDDGNRLKAAPVIIDGGGLITLDGGGASRILKTEAWHSLSVRNLTLINGKVEQPASDPRFEPGIYGGGAIYGGYQSAVEIINSTFTGNDVGIGGGAVFVGSDGALTIVGSTFSKNHSWFGGAVYSLLSPLTVVNSVFTNNSATQTNWDTPELGEAGALITDGASLASYNEGGTGKTISLCGVTIKDNDAESMGGASLWAYAPDQILVKNSSFENNISRTGFGGAARIGLGWPRTDELLVDDVITKPGKIDISGSSFISNWSGSNGGALYLDCYGDCDIRNSTFFGNHSDFGVGAAVFSGGLEETGHGHLPTKGKFHNVTFVNNSNWVTVFGDRFTFENTIFVSDTAQIMCSQPDNPDYANTGHDILEYSTLGPVTASCLPLGATVSSDPLLAYPADNGGPTQTMLPASNSPALQAGTACEATDQRGIARTTARCDLGAVERQ